ncbi:hypothetical protein C2845_PM07G02540 [Panicum miliaceum]|uniref:SIAH-type domain-containing protein n=1 Tax=Panicum miliaceum TaxID=4540 RepID=A0A3L6SLA5_PANMI|nr:hypothetical protein C2845_PM07G02540 [Panicum miliaceum]
MRKRKQQSSAKKAMSGVKQRAAEVGATGGLDMAVEAAESRVELTVRIDMAKLHCPRCNHPFKPPIFQFLCDAGHLACSNCHGQLPKDKCYACGQDGAFRRNTTLEDVVNWPRILCPFDVYGCRISVPYHEFGDHQRECPCAPCGCSESGCSFVGSPPMLRVHLREAQGWPVDKIRYSRPHDLSLPESQRRRLLLAEDGCLFLVVAVGAPGEANAAAGPQYTCRMRAMGHKAVEAAKAQSVTMEMEVPSWAVPLVVHPKMLRGTSTIHLSVCIDEELTKGATMELALSEQLKERQEMEKNPQKLAKAMDYLERAKREEEAPLIEKAFQKQVEEEKILHEQEQLVRSLLFFCCLCNVDNSEIELSKQHHAGDLQAKNRLSRMLEHKNAFQERIVQQRVSEFGRQKKERDEWISQLISSRKLERETIRKFTYYLNLETMRMVIRFREKEEARKPEMADLPCSIYWEKRRRRRGSARASAIVRCRADVPSVFIKLK